MALLDSALEWECPYLYETNHSETNSSKIYY